MTALLKLWFITFTFYIFTGDNCDLLSDGNYRFIQIVKSPQTSVDKRFESRVSIDDNNFSQQWDNGDSAKGKIKWIYDCTFKLDYQNRQNRDTSELSKLLLKSFGDACFELKDKKGDTIKFRTTYSGNLHVTTSEGMIIKIR